MRTSKDIPKRQLYMDENFGKEDDVLEKVRSALKEDGKEGINVGPNEGAILKMLLSLAKANSVVEVGTLYGYSAIWMARALPKEGRLYCLEKSEENFVKASKLIGASDVAEKVTLIHGDALEGLESLSSKGPFDVVFIDANKGGYGAYLDWAEKNVKPGGLIIGDNTFLFGHVYGEGREHSNVGPNPVKTMLEFNQRLSDPEKYISCILPTDEGMTVAIKR
ncbi:MAG: methyltransferase [Bdellovibrionaceae bacterium]|nr:methyltransferase [Pseudobdellovibrionaceae bacterium]|tara:strand:+ start:90 stop:752 length:663 start_codon:yes stop_codon:yes gene_type:complete